MSFPLADWIVGHAGLPHDLAQSGMKGQLPSVLPCLRTPPAGDPGELRSELARVLGVASDRIVLTPGATTGNTLVLLHLRAGLHRRGGRRLCAALRPPEYPPLEATARTLGYRVSLAPGGTPSDVRVLSNPSNPLGWALSTKDLREVAASSEALLVDETFREFSSLPTFAREGIPGVWTTGSFTKIYGADDIRVGYVITPPGEGPRFRDRAELWTDRLALHSVGAALAILRRRARVLREARALFRRNLGVLRQRLPHVPPLQAPVWFDRGPRGEATERFARRALRAGVLICPGHFFGEPSGVRVCLTRRSFPRDLEAYLRLREGPGAPGGSPRRSSGEREATISEPAAPS